MTEFNSIALNWIIYFIFYSVIGWIVESIYCTIRTRPLRFVNRGFMFGPACPLYGVAFVVVSALIYPFRDANLLQQFILMVVILSTVEYISSYVLEKVFHARWWSYHNSWYNFTINGRITFWTSIGFGIGCTIVLKFIHPNVANFVGSLDLNVKVIIAAILATIYLLDFWLSSKVASTIKYVFTGGKKDVTEEYKHYAVNYYRKESRTTRKSAKKAIRPIKKEQKQSIKGLKGQKRKVQKKAAKAVYREKRREVKKAVAEANIKTTRKNAK